VEVEDGSSGSGSGNGSGGDSVSPPTSDEEKV
jgi:hypothetical protein